MAPAVAVDIARTMITLGPMTLNLDDGRVTFGDHDEIELATATDPVCGCELRRADAAGAVDHHGLVYFFCSVACHDSFLEEPERYARPDEAALAGP